ncbi:MAG: HEAT repeat domain-containing protein [Pseudomonadales bacterium]
MLADSNDSLVKGLSSPQPPVVIDAALQLGYCRCSAAIEELAKNLSHSDPVVRRVSAWALGQIGSTQSLPALTNLLQDDHPLVVESAIFALGKLGRAEAVNPILSSIAIQPAGLNRKIVGRRGPTRLLNPLSEDEPVDLYSASQFALRNIALHDPLAIVKLEQALKSEAEQVRFTAARVLQETNTDLGKKALARSLGRDSASICGAYRLHDRSDPANLRALKRCVIQFDDFGALGYLLGSENEETARWAADHGERMGLKHVSPAVRTR